MKTKTTIEEIVNTICDTKYTPIDLKTINISKFSKEYIDQLDFVNLKYNINYDVKE